MVPQPVADKADHTGAQALCDGSAELLPELLLPLAATRTPWYTSAVELLVISGRQHEQSA